MHRQPAERLDSTQSTSKNEKTGNKRTIVHVVVECMIKKNNRIFDFFYKLPIETFKEIKQNKEDIIDERKKMTDEENNNSSSESNNAAARIRDELKIGEVVRLFVCV